MPETGEEKFLMALEAKSRALVSDLEVLKEQLAILPSLEAKIDLESHLENLIKEIKAGDFFLNSLERIETLSALAQSLGDYLTDREKDIVSPYLRERIKDVLEKIDDLIEMALDNQQKKRNPLTDEREWK